MPWVIGLATGLFFMALVVASVDLPGLWRRAANVSPIWLVSGMVAFTLAMLVRIYRWHEILLPLRNELTVREVARPLLVGYALNNVFPARLGELFRAHYARSEFRLSRSSVLGSIVVERASDLLVVLLFLAVGTATALASRPEVQSLPWTLVRSSVIVLMLVAAFIFALTWIGRQRIVGRFPAISRRLDDFRLGVLAIGEGRLARIALASLMLWMLECMALWSMLAATGVILNGAQVALVLGCVSLSTLIPSAPGFIGTLQFAFMLALGLIGEDRESGVVAATLMQLLLYLPATIMGIFMAAKAKLRIRVEALSAD